jgi:hypothetical protein
VTGATSQSLRGRLGRGPGQAGLGSRGGDAPDLAARPGSRDGHAVTAAERLAADPELVSTDRGRIPQAADPALRVLIRHFSVVVRATLTSPSLPGRERFVPHVGQSHASRSPRRPLSEGERCGPHSRERLCRHACARMARSTSQRFPVSSKTTRSLRRAPAQMALTMLIETYIRRGGAHRRTTSNNTRGPDETAYEFSWLWQEAPADEHSRNREGLQRGEHQGQSV